MQILHRFAGSIQQYLKQISDPDICRPDRCPLCQSLSCLIAWGFYKRSLVDLDFDGIIPVRRYRCALCHRTVSLLPEFALPAGAVLDPPLPNTGDRLVRRPGRTDSCDICRNLRCPGIANAESGGLDSSSPFSFFRAALAPARLASFSRSQWDSCQAPTG